jgi:hypothetical protein
MMTYWLLVYLFTPEGEFMAKDIYETASIEQCQDFAGQVTKTLINTTISAQYYCVSDDDYRAMIYGDGV